MSLQNIEHIFVLMMENRSFDHMLGSSGITGTDAVSGAPTQIEGVPPGGCNNKDAKGVAYPTNTPAPFIMPEDPNHEFDDVRLQLLGTDDPFALYEITPIQNNGFVLSYANTAGGNPLSDIMAGFTQAQLPILNQLAQEFCVCDHWFSSLPGPTVPNRLFLHAATSGGNPYSPNPIQLAAAVVDGDASYKFANGNIFSRLIQYFATNKLKSTPWRIYHGDDFAMVYALNGVSYGSGKSIDPSQTNPNPFAQDLEDPNLPSYVFIEPNWGNLFLLGSYKGGNSQHPVDDVTSGESLIKYVYEAIRGSSIWDKSLLIITYDEHGGFFDHYAPPGRMPAPGDVPPVYGFDFTQFGVRVPAVVISPWIPKNLIDHTVYDHTTVLATLREWYQEINLGDIGYFTNRDLLANNLSHLLSLTQPRTDPKDAPLILNNVATSGVILPQAQLIMNAADSDFASFPGANQPLEPNQVAFLQVALKHHLEMTPKQDHRAILQRVRQIKTKGEAKLYMRDVKRMLDAKTKAKETIPEARNYKSKTNSKIKARTLKRSSKK